MDATLDFVIFISTLRMEYCRRLYGHHSKPVPSRGCCGYDSPIVRAPKGWSMKTPLRLELQYQK
ncbi:hypothetical protein DPMN_002024 [Dreissena polymorpha]|uniref:Uncharacterized protein n=1 Tax=Dreissena polymorpha TaxID=45954 RepID=A0A9D4ML64_DREPO|nr:hypothetical protein DPMN_002024 [Dreissena polymorpha]